MAISGTPRRLISGRMVRISGVSPEFEIASTTSVAVIIPRSPWLASPGWTKKDGVPVLASVAAILPATWPDLPMPVTTTRPRHARQRRQASTKCRPDAVPQRQHRRRLDVEHLAAEPRDAVTVECRLPRPSASPHHQPAVVAQEGASRMAPSTRPMRLLPPKL
jgi:hypothetical protein